MLIKTWAFQARLFVPNEVLTIHLPSIYSDVVLVPASLFASALRLPFTSRLVSLGAETLYGGGEDRGRLVGDGYGSAVGLVCGHSF
jgi:hypothetical protein